MHFSSGENQILETKCIKQHAFLVDPLGVSYDFPNAHTLIFLLRKWEERDSKQERGSKSVFCVEISISQTPKGAHSDRKRSPKREPFRVLGDEKGPVLAAHPVFSSIFWMWLACVSSCARARCSVAAPRIKKFLTNLAHRTGDATERPTAPTSSLGTNKGES